MTLRNESLFDKNLSINRQTGRGAFVAREFCGCAMKRKMKANMCLICTYVHVRTYICTHVSRMYIRTCTYIHMYMYVHTYVHMCIVL